MHAVEVDPGPAPVEGSRDEVGMRLSPEAVLFVGGTVLTVVLLAVFVPFMVRAWRSDAAQRAARGRDGTHG
jgi:hypothetical protein